MPPRPTYDKGPSALKTVSLKILAQFKALWRLDSLITKHTFRVRTPSEIQKSRVFQGCFAVFSRAFPGFLEVQNEKQHSQRIVIT